MLGSAATAMQPRLELKINWAGRLGVAPTMGAPFFAMSGVHWLALVLLYVGLALSLVATALYVRSGGVSELRQRKALKLSLTLWIAGYTRASSPTNLPYPGGAVPWTRHFPISAR